MLRAMRTAVRVALWATLVMLFACRSGGAEDPSAAPPTPAAPAAPHIRFAPAPEGDVAAAVRAFVEQARAQDREPVVYVGASWCEPCRYFHAAAEAGELDAELPRLALLEFDRDRRLCGG